MEKNIAYYKSIQNAYGTTSKKDANIAGLKQNISSHFSDSTDYESSTKVDGVIQPLIVISTKQNNIKKIIADVNDTIVVGQVVECYGVKYLITEVDSNGEVYYKGKMQECNYTLLFQSPTDYSILSYPCIDDANSTMGLDVNNTITTLNGIHHIKLPFDNNTKLIGVKNRFFLDRYGTTTYKTTNVNNTTYSYGDKGFIELTLQQDSAYNPNTDKNGICNYIANYTVELSAINLSLDVGTTSQITAVCKTNGVIAPTQTVIYTSSDVNIATVSNTGLVTAIASGTVTITATWVEQNKTATLIYSIASSAVANIGSISVVASGSMIIGTTRTITAKAMNVDGSINTTENLTWKVTYPSGYESLFTETITSDRIHKIKLADTDDFKIIGKFVSVTVSDTTGMISKTMSLKISG